MNKPEVGVQGEGIDFSTEGKFFDNSVGLMHFKPNISCMIALTFGK